MKGDRRSTEFVSNVLASYAPNSSSSGQTPNYPVQESTYSFLVCLPPSNTFVTDLLDKVIGFVLVKGIPEGVSLVDMFSNLPDLKKSLESSSYAGGSLTHLMSYVQSQSNQEYVTRQLEDLIEKAMEAETEYVDMTSGIRHQHSSVLRDSLYEAPCDVIPSRTGLELPEGVTSMITSDCGQHIMERFRDGEISGYKAIEIVRDTVSLSQPASQSQKKKSNGRKVRPQSHFYVSLDGLAAAADALSPVPPRGQLPFACQNPSKPRQLVKSQTDVSLTPSRGSIQPFSSPRSRHVSGDDGKPFLQGLPANNRHSDSGGTRNDYCFINPHSTTGAGRLRGSAGSHDERETQDRQPPPLPPRKDKDT